MTYHNILLCFISGDPSRTLFLFYSVGHMPYRIYNGSQVMKMQKYYYITININRQLADVLYFMNACFLVSCILYFHTIVFISHLCVLLNAIILKVASATSSHILGTMYYYVYDVVHICSM